MVARARNDGGAGGAASHGRAARAPPCPPSLRGGGAAEAIQAAAPRVMGGRRPVWPCPILDCFALAWARARNDGGAGSAASHGREVRAPPCPPSLRGGGAAEAIQAAVPRVMGGRRPVWPCPILDCFALACARARNDGGAGSAASHGREVRAPPCPPSLRGGGAAEAIQAAVPRVMGGRCTVWPCPILDCFALASLALAMTEERTAPLPRPPAPVAIDEARSSRRNSPRADCWH